MTRVSTQRCYSPTIVIMWNQWFHIVVPLWCTGVRREDRPAPPTHATAPHTHHHRTTRRASKPWPPTARRPSTAQPSCCRVSCSPTSRPRSATSSPTPGWPSRPRRACSRRSSGTAWCTATTGGYEAGPLFALYASRHDADDELIRLAQPALEALGARHRRDRQPRDRPRGNAVVQIAQIDATFLLGTTNWVDVDVPAHCSALGKVFYASRRVCRFPARPMERRTRPHGHEPSRAALASSSTIATQGYARGARRARDRPRRHRGTGRRPGRQRRRRGRGVRAERPARPPAAAARRRCSHPMPRRSPTILGPPETGRRAPHDARRAAQDAVRRDACRAMRRRCWP